MEKLYTIDEIKRISVPIAKRYGVQKLALFGSYARGDAKPGSDIDFLIEKGEVRDYYVFYGFVHALEDDLGIDIDVVTYDSLKQSLIGDVADEEVVLYEG